MRHLARQPLRWLRYRRGDGVHSPFAYNMILRVLRARHPYYAFDSLPRSISQEQKAGWHRRDLELLFRLYHEWDTSKHSILLSPYPIAPLHYLQATSKATNLHTFELRGQLPHIDMHRVGFALLDGVLSTTTLPELERALSPSKLLDKEGTMIIFTTRTHSERKLARQLSRTLLPTVCFDLVWLQIWVYREALTTGHYQVFYR